MSDKIEQHSDFPVDSEAWLQEWAREKFTYAGSYRPRVLGQLYGNTDWALARALHSAIVAAVMPAAAQSAPAAPVAQEPVAWVCTARKPGITEQRSLWHGEQGADTWLAHFAGRGCEVTKTPLYTAPPATEQPDTVNLLVAALRPFADAFDATGLPQYRGADAEHAAFLDENQVTPARGITMGQFRRAWEVLSGKSVLRGAEQQGG